MAAERSPADLESLLVQWLFEPVYSAAECIGNTKSRLSLAAEICLPKENDTQELSTKFFQVQLSQAPNRRQQFTKWVLSELGRTSRSTIAGLGAMVKVADFDVEPLKDGVGVSFFTCAQDLKRLP